MVPYSQHCSHFIVNLEYICWYRLGVRFVGVLIIRALQFGVYDGAPDFCKPPYELHIVDSTDHIKGGHRVFDIGYIIGPARFLT